MSELTSQSQAIENELREHSNQANLTAEEALGAKSSLQEIISAVKSLKELSHSLLQTSTQQSNDVEVAEHHVMGISVISSNTHSLSKTINADANLLKDNSVKLTKKLSRFISKGFVYIDEDDQSKNKNQENNEDETVEFF